MNGSQARPTVLQTPAMPDRVLTLVAWSALVARASSMVPKKLAACKPRDGELTRSCQVWAGAMSD